jgi:hypothetical protein
MARCKYYGFLASIFSLQGKGIMDSIKKVLTGTFPCINLIMATTLTKKKVDGSGRYKMKPTKQAKFVPVLF